MWSMVRKSLPVIGCSIEHQDDNYHLRTDAHSAKAGKWKAVGSVLKRARDDHRKRLLLECQDQGRSFHLLTKDESSNHWLPSGRYTSFAAYRFAVKARLNLLPVMTV